MGLKKGLPALPTRLTPLFYIDFDAVMKHCKYVFEIKIKTDFKGWGKGGCRKITPIVLPSSWVSNQWQPGKINHLPVLVAQ